MRPLLDPQSGVDFPIAVFLYDPVEQKFFDTESSPLSRLREKGANYFCADP